MAPPVPGVKPEGGNPPQLSEIQSHYMKKAQSWNHERLLQLKSLRMKNIFTGLLLGAAVVGIYTYSITAIRQESFLDDLNEPERVEE